MKIGILTFHFAFNQGAVLQCYALQTFLERQGHEAVVIDYRPGYHTVMHAAWRNPFAYAAVFWKKFRSRNLLVRSYLTARSFVRCMGWNLLMVDGKNQTAFRKFVAEHLRLTREYTSLKQLQSFPPELDAYISGSDQVWNPDLLGQEFDPAYFLDFGPREVRRLTYAVSLGKRMYIHNLLKMNELCKNIDALSLREANTEALAVIGRDVHICVDPTFLLDAADYASAESTDVEEEPYIFAYGFETNDALRQAVSLAVAKYHCRIINGSPKWLKLSGDVVKLTGYGPDRFLTLIKHSACVITNSFHGTAFSIIYRKDFITVPHTTRGKRMTELLGRLGLSSRLFGSADFSLDTPLDYDAVGAKLRILRAHSAEYLSLALSGRRGEEIPHHAEELPAEAANSLTAYYGYFRESESLAQSASGGAATALAEKVIEEGGVVFGVAFSEDFRSAEFRCVESLGELGALQGTKYIPPNGKIQGKSIYEVVQEKLLSKRKVLFVGSGCQVGALLGVLHNNNKIDTSNLYTVDLICHGPTTQEVYNAFLSELEAKFHSTVASVNMRHKKNGWVPPFLRVVFANGEIYEKRLYETSLGFALRVCTREACYQCKFKGDNHLADITVGDYWGLRPGMSEYNKNGVSALLARTAKGRQLVESLASARFLVGKTDAERILRRNRMYDVSLKRPDYIDKFRRDLSERGLHYAVLHSAGLPEYLRLGLKNRLRRWLGRS